MLRLFYIFFCCLIYIEGDKNISTTAKNGVENVGNFVISTTPIIKTTANIVNNSIPTSKEIIFNNLTTTFFSTTYLPSPTPEYTSNNTSTTKLLSKREFQSTIKSPTAPLEELFNKTSGLPSTVKSTTTSTGKNSMPVEMSSNTNDTISLTTIIWLSTPNYSDSDIEKKGVFIVAIIIQVIVMLIVCFVLYKCIHKKKVKHTSNTNTNTIALDEFNR